MGKNWYEKNKEHHVENVMANTRNAKQAARKYVYPSRNTRLRRLTLVLTYLYGAIGVWGLMQYPSVPQWIVWISLVYVAYYALLSFFPKIGGAKPA